MATTYERLKLTRPTLASRCAAVFGLVALILLVLPAAPASAHAVLVSSTPANGARLDTPPDLVRLQFSEGVELIDGGLRLLNGAGASVDTGQPRVSGHTVQWPMPKELPRGTYLVNWRVVSADGHPVSGAFSFGVATDVVAVGATATQTAGTAPWWVVAVRFAGYLSYAALLGVVVFALWCFPGIQSDPRIDRLLIGALAGGLLATTAGLLVQGPYVAGTGLGSLFEKGRFAPIHNSLFMQALEWRLLLYVALLVILVLDWSGSRALRWSVAGILTLNAVTFALSGHAAAQGRLFDEAVDTIHVLAASVWVGGLVVLAVLGRSIEATVLHRFSRLAMAAVLALVASGVVNSVLHVHRLGDLVHTRYGTLLSVKVMVVGVALAGAAVSRRRLHQRVSLTRSVRLEALATVSVLAITSVLTLTAPPAAVRGVADRSSSAAGRTGASGAAGSGAAGGTATTKLLGGSTAEIRVEPPTTSQAQIVVTVRDSNRRVLHPRNVSLRASLPSRDVSNLAVPLTPGKDAWTGRFTFPLPGRWTLSLTVENQSLQAVVATAPISIRTRD